MSDYLAAAYGTRSTPQSEPIPNSNQVPNSAGGHAWAVDDWVRLERFLIMGSEGGTFYASERELTKENAACVLRCLKLDGARTVEMIVEISTKGRAASNKPALFCLAAASADPVAKSSALAALPLVARIGTHLFLFMNYVKMFRGMGRSLKRALQNWYQDKATDDLAYQVVKYQSREKWSHRDVLRLAKPVPTTEEQSSVYKWASFVKDLEDPDRSPLTVSSPTILVAYENMKAATHEKDVIRLINDHGLTREMVPTRWHTSPAVWEALLEKMPYTAMLRNLANMTRVGLLKPLGQSTKMVAERLVDENRLRKTRAHPIAILSALKIYERGYGERGSHSWEPVGEIISALNEAFYLAFENVEPTGKRHLLALDVSGSMAGCNVLGLPYLTCSVASAALAMATLRSEQQTAAIAFTRTLTPFPMTREQRLDDVVNRMSRLPFGGTDCAQPMLWALANKVEVDAFVIYTDSETWAGQIHPSQALVQYREKTGINAKLIVVGMASNGFSIADPLDAGMLDCVGLSTATPSVISQFVATPAP